MTAAILSPLTNDMALKAIPLAEASCIKKGSQDFNTCQFQELSLVAYGYIALALDQQERAHIPRSVDKNY